MQQVQSGNRKLWLTDRYWVRSCNIINYLPNCNRTFNTLKYIKSQSHVSLAKWLARWWSLGSLTNQHLTWKLFMAATSREGILCSCWSPAAHTCKFDLIGQKALQNNGCTSFSWNPCLPLHLSWQKSSEHLYISYSFLCCSTSSSSLLSDLSRTGLENNVPAV